MLSTSCATPKRQRFTRGNILIGPPWGLGQQGGPQLNGLAGAVVFFIFFWGPDYNGGSGEQVAAVAEVCIEEDGHGNWGEEPFYCVADEDLAEGGLFAFDTQAPN